MTQTDEKKGEIVTLHPTPKIDLHSPNAVRREIGAVYRDMRANRIDPADGTKMGFMLNLLLRAHEVCDLQKKIDEINDIMRIREKDDKESKRNKTLR